VWLGGGVDSQAFSLFAPVLMFSPAVGAFVTMRVECQPFRSVLRGAGRVRDYAAGILVPAVTALAASLLIHGWLGGTPPASELRGSAVSIPERSAFRGSGDESLVV
jgi:hypothetical protein